MCNPPPAQAIKRRQTDKDIDDEVAAALAAYGARGPEHLLSPKGPSIIMVYT